MNQRLLKEMKRWFGTSPQSMELMQRIENRGIMSNTHYMVLGNILHQPINKRIKYTRNQVGNMNHNLKKLHKQGYFINVPMFKYNQ